MSCAGTLLLDVLVVVAGLASPDTVRTTDGRELPLFGLAGPDAPPSIQAAELAAGEWSASVLWQWDGAEHQYARAYWLERGDRALNLELVRAGHALAAVIDRAGEHVDGFVQAAEQAQRARAGLWARVRRPRMETALEELLPIGGVALPMHASDPEYDYARELTEIRALGAEWVSLLIAARQPLVDSSRVEPPRLPSLERIAATIEAARERELEVLLLPIVLIAEPEPDDWRGTLAPTQREAWWQSYAAYLARMADVGARSGASALSIGSELASLERDEAAWRRVVANLRCRFPGFLTYSANWDHAHGPGFWDALDFASMTAYFELTGARAPTRAQLADGWRRALGEVRELARTSGCAVVLTEIGIPSQEGAAAWPWDYTRRAPVDLALQERTFETFAEVFLPDGKPAAGWNGLFFYDWWGFGGTDDGGYTARGKPAEITWRAILRSLEPE